MYREVKDRKGSNPRAGLPDRRRSERRAHVLRALPLRQLPAPRRHRGARTSAASTRWTGITRNGWRSRCQIVIGSCTDALLTLILVERGVASEANPLMAPLLGHSALAFALVKVVLTAGGVVLLTQLARIRAFGRIPVGAVPLIWYFVIYGVLITYGNKPAQHLPVSARRGVGFRSVGTFCAKL